MFVQLVQTQTRSILSILNRVPLPISVALLAVLSGQSEAEVIASVKDPWNLCTIGGTLFVQCTEKIPQEELLICEDVLDAVLKIHQYPFISPVQKSRAVVCPHVTRCSDSACEFRHLVEIVSKHTVREAGVCSYLDLCTNKECKFIHFKDPYERKLSSNSVDETSSWLNSDIRFLPLSNIFQNSLVRAILIDPPWDIHMDLSFGTLTDSEMLALDVGGIHDSNNGGFVFLWATNRTLELARKCLRYWGYDPVDDIVWVKTNQLGGTVRSGRTGHWLNHAKEHCIIGVKGNVGYAKFGHHRVYSDVIVAPVRENSRKPDEVYDVIESIVNSQKESLMCLELFGRSHNRRADATVVSETCYAFPIGMDDLEWPSPIRKQASRRSSVLSTIGDLLDNGYLSEREVCDCIQLVFLGNNGLETMQDLIASRKEMTAQAQFIRMYLYNTTHCATPCFEIDASPCDSLLVPTAVRPSAPGPSENGKDAQESPESMKSTNPGGSVDRSIYRE